MTPAARTSSLTSLVSVVGALLIAGPAAAQRPTTLPSETPDTVRPATGAFDYVRREAMIPMRDGVRLYTVILVPKGARGAPILLTRTPYSADELTHNTQSAHLGPTLYGYDNATDVIVEGGYIRVVQHPGSCRRRPAQPARPSAEVVAVRRPCMSGAADRRDPVGLRRDRRGPGLRLRGGTRRCSSSTCRARPRRARRATGPSRSRCPGPADGPTSR